MAQSLEEITLGLLKIKGYIDNYFDLVSLTQKYQTDVSQWNFISHEECWTHDELEKALKLELAGVDVILSAINPSDVLFKQTLELAGAMLSVASEGIDLGDIDPFKDLPDPVRFRIYHVPMPIQAITVQSLGACQVSEATPPVSGGFGTLMAQQPSSIVEAPTIKPSLSEAQQLPDDTVEIPTIEPAPISAESPGEVILTSMMDGMEMVLIPAGEFMMGSDNGKPL
jgi:hypothetical protein